MECIFCYICPVHNIEIEDITNGSSIAQFDMAVDSVQPNCWVLIQPVHPLFPRWISDQLMFHQPLQVIHLVH